MNEELFGNLGLKLGGGGRAGGVANPTVCIVGMRYTQLDLILKILTECFNFHMMFMVQYSSTKDIITAVSNTLLLHEKA